MIGYESFVETFAIPKDWLYRGEGNCNVVLSLPSRRQILRIRKTEKPRSIFGWILVLINDFLYWYYGKGLRDELRDISFYTKIMRPLIGNCYTSEAKQVFLTRKQVQIFNYKLSKIRPEFRQTKTLQYGRAAVFDDFAYLPSEYDNLEFSDNSDTFSVEIKPKQGWRPLKEQTHTECFFCMNQFLKLEKKQVKQRSRYCPEDFFSGDKERMIGALKSLIQVPQNNFKIFKNGMVLYDDKQKNIGILEDIFESKDSQNILCEELCIFLQQCLVTDLSKNGDRNCSFGTYNNDLNIKSTNSDINLVKGCVLERILSVQMLDSEGSHSTYKKLSRSDMWDDWSFVEKILEIIDDNKDMCIKCNIVEASKAFENELTFVPYLISAISKDCSLMITFRKLKDDACKDLESKNIFKSRYGSFLFNIGVFDLYPKPLSTIHKHYKRNKDIFNAWKRREVEI